MALLAAAHGVVVDHLALGGGPAGPGARVAALQSSTFIRLVTCKNEWKEDQE